MSLGFLRSPPLSLSLFRKRDELLMTLLSPARSSRRDERTDEQDSMSPELAAAPSPSFPAYSLSPPLLRSFLLSCNTHGTHDDKLQEFRYIMPLLPLPPHFI